MARPSRRTDVVCGQARSQQGSPDLVNWSGGLRPLPHFTNAVQLGLSGPRRALACPAWQMKLIWKIINAITRSRRGSRPSDQLSGLPVTACPSPGTYPPAQYRISTSGRKWRHGGPLVRDQRDSPLKAGAGASKRAVVGIAQHSRGPSTPGLVRRVRSACPPYIPIDFARRKFYVTPVIEVFTSVPPDPVSIVHCRHWVFCWRVSTSTTDSTTQAETSIPPACTRLSRRP